MHIFVVCVWGGDNKNKKNKKLKESFIQEKIFKEVLKPCIVNSETKRKGIFVCFYYFKLYFKEGKK